MYKACLSLIIVLVFAIPQVFAAGDPSVGKEKSQVCAACHSADGNSVNPDWPKLAGQHEDYLIKQLMDFRSGDRENVQMSPMVANLTDEDIRDLAAYFASQKIKHGTTDPATLELGEKIYRSGNINAGVPACSACHGPAGRGNPAAKYPALGGQHAAYTTTQLNAFRSNARANDINKVMRTIVGRMTDEEIKAVAQFTQGLHFRE